MITTLKPREKRFLLAGLFVLLAGLYTWPIFAVPHNWGIQDWDHDLFWHAFPRDSLIQFQEFPLWCPYLNGGVPYLARAESSVCSPLFLPVLLFGELAGIRISIFLHTVIGLLGAYLLGRHFKLDATASVYSSIVYNLSSFFALTVTCGMTLFLPSSYLPLIFLFFLKGIHNSKWWIGCSLLLAVVIGEGGAYLLVIISFFLFIYVLFHLRRNSRALVKGLVIVGVLTFCFGAVKILPFYDLVHEHKRPIRDITGFTPKSLAYSLLYPDQKITSPVWWKVAAAGAYGPDEHGMHIGWVAALFAVLGMILHGRENPRMLLMFLFFLWLILGYHAPVVEWGGHKISLSLWDFLRRLPVFDSMRVAQRFRFVWLMILALYSGTGVFWLFRKIEAAPAVKTRKVLKTTLILIIIASCTHLTVVNGSIFSHAFSIKPQPLYPDKTFRQIGAFQLYDNNGFIENVHPLGTLSSYYYAYLSNKGTVWSALSHHSLPKKAVPFFEPAYRGEVFLENNKGRIAGARMTHNTVQVDVELDSGDTLVVNQNYYTGWKVKSGSGKQYSVLDREGLISVRLEPGSDRITLYYLPAMFIAGLAITGATLFVCAGWLLWPYLVRRFKSENGSE